MFLSLYEIVGFAVLLAVAHIAERAAVRSANPARGRGAAMMAYAVIFGIVAGYMIGTQAAWRVARLAAQNHVPAQEISERIESVFLSPWTLTLAVSLFTLVRSRMTRETSRRNSGKRI